MVDLTLYYSLIITLTTAVASVLIWQQVFTPPPSLSHLPAVPALSLLLSYASLESEDKRTKRLIVAYANKHGHPFVLVWTFGLWIVHIVDYKIVQQIWKDNRYAKPLPPQDSLFWKFVGSKNILFASGEEWELHARVVHPALQGPPPISDFASVTHSLLKHISTSKGRIDWTELSQRVTLDVLGKTVLGYDFNAIQDPHSPFVDGYNRVMAGLMAPLYMFLPMLDRYFPRKRMNAEMLGLRAFFQDIIQHKKKEPGEDVISSMLVDTKLGEEDLLDTMVVLFIAGHDTTSGALTSTVYYLAKHPHYQEQARKEVQAVLGNSVDPDLVSLKDMPFVASCIKEAMRMNDPSNCTLPRSANFPTKAGDYIIPAGATFVFNIYALHHLEAIWPKNEIYDPSRFGHGSASLNDILASYSFSYGPRACPAKAFAMWELRTIVCLLLKHYRWTLPPGSIHHSGVQNEFAFGVNINIPKHLEVEFTPI